ADGEVFEVLEWHGAARGLEPRSTEGTAPARPLVHLALGCRRLCFWATRNRYRARKSVPARATSSVAPRLGRPPPPRDEWPPQTRNNRSLNGLGRGRRGR